MEVVRLKPRNSLIAAWEAASQEERQALRDHISKPEKSSQTAREILSFLNEKAGRAFRPTESNLKGIRARLREGYTETEIRQVVMRKIRDWQHDDMMSQYLRPATLFNAEKFNQYAGELVDG